jgi:hypothetical protein
VARSENAKAKQGAEPPRDKVLRIKASAHTKSTATAQVRKIQDSPVADRKLVEAVRKSLRVLEKKGGQKAYRKAQSSEAPFVTAVK